jgi:large subunit ribosomal protein L21
VSVYAIIHTGGKQYRVSPGDVVRVEKLTVQPGEKMELDQVYLLALDGRVTAGNPFLKNARVVTQVLGHDRGEKLIIFKHRRRKGYRKTMGHRQYFTELKVIEIIHEGVSYHEQPEKQRQSQKAAVVATTQPVKKDDAAKQQPAAKKKHEKPPASATKPEPEKTPPSQRQPEKPKPAEQGIAPEPTPIAHTTAPEISKKEETAVPAAPPREPEKPHTPVQAALEEKPRRAEQASSETASDKRRRWWIIGAIIAALALLALVLLIGGNRPSPRPENRQETVGKPAPEKQSTPKPPVRDVKMKKTAPVDKPSAPAQPPD